jgi:parallel beta-helix repeat protein
MADVSAFYNLALHSANSSIIAFTPAVTPGLNHTATIDLLEGILGNQGRTLVFTSEPSLRSVSLPISEPITNTTRTSESIGSNTSSSIVLDAGIWDMSRLQTRYPADITVVSTQDGPAYLVDTTIIVEEGAQVTIAGANILMVSPADDRDRRIEVQGNLSITNSRISSWDQARSSPDSNPYHQRPFIFIDEGRLTIDNSSISHMGFQLSGFGADRSARAAIIIHESDGFSVTNSSLSFNYDALFARNSSEAIISGTEVYANTRTGISLRSGSSSVNIVGNHVHDNGYEGIECIECVRSVISQNVAEHNKEAGIKLIASNFSAILENDVRYNEKSGIYLRDKSTENSIRANTITDNREGIRLAGNSSNNLIFENSLLQNHEAIDIDDTSRPNQQRNNRIAD